MVNVLCRNGNNSVDDLLTEISLCNFLHFTQYHGRDFFRGESSRLAADLDLNVGLISLVDDLERIVLGVALNILVIKTTSNETFGVKDGVLWILWGLILCRVSDKSLS